MGEFVVQAQGGGGFPRASFARAIGTTLPV